jgi:hypothetical protein
VMTKENLVVSKTGHFGNSHLFLEGSQMSSRVPSAHFADDQLRKMPHWGGCQPLVEKFPENTP